MELAWILPAFISFGITAVAAPFVIAYLRKLKMRQTERKEGVASHLKKAGTPTMGGITFLAAVLVTTLFFIPGHTNVIPVLILTVGFGLIGFLDDYLKVVLHRSDGLIAWQKLLLQIAFTTVFAIYLYRSDVISLDMRIPFGNHMLDPGILTIPILFFAVLGTVNGVNFTDGLDGLASSVTLVVAVFFSIAAIVLKNNAAPVSSAMAGGLMGFLLYNAYPARVFMGDTGSLALGGFVAGMAYVLEMPLFILIFGIIYLVEVLSVIIQVTYFKATHGRRVFKMAPIHHHFELCGWSETRIVTVFTVITILACLLSLLAL